MYPTPQVHRIGRMPLVQKTIGVIEWIRSVLENLFKCDNTKHRLNVTTESATSFTPSVQDPGRSPQIFALLIGINVYNFVESTVEGSSNMERTRVLPDDGTQPKFNDLHCAVSDGQKFEDYLKKDLKVAEDHITFLKDTEATRDKIINAFERLADDKRICQGDAIFIFYAGHGTQAFAPQWMAGNGNPKIIEVLVPSDFNRDPNNYEHKGIPDFTMAALLNRVSHAKGDNITIVFDCCHSASALRGSASDDSRSILRTRDNPASIYKVPEDLDKDLLCNMRVRGITTDGELKNYGTSSYVYFAACASSESAREDMGYGGRFSQALLSVLQNPNSDILTCSDIIQHLPPIEGQHPICEGIHKNKPIFQSYDPSDAQKFFDVYDGPVKDPSYDFFIYEGQAHGLALNDELVIFKGKSNEDRKKTVGIAHIIAFDSATQITKLKAFPDATSFNLPCHPAPALLRRSNEIHLILYVDLSDGQLNDRIRHLLASDHLGDVVITYNRRAAQIGLSVDKGKNELRFDVHDSALIDKNVELKPRFAPNDDAALLHVLKGLVHYYWHLKRTSSKNPLPLDNILFSFVDVKDTFLKDTQRFVAHEKNSNYIDATGCIEMIVNDLDSGDSGPYYGFQLEHTALKNPKLYPTLFYFDNVDFTIAYAFNPALGSSPEAPWSQSVMGIGYGSGAGATVAPFSFNINPGSDLEAGFFKLFLSNKPIDLDCMLQEVSPFTSLRSVLQKTPPLRQKFTHQWTEKTFPVIIRRNNNSH